MMMNVAMTDAGSSKMLDQSALLARYGALLLCAMASFIVIYAVVSPGFLSPFAPLHSDVYRYFDISHRPIVGNNLLAPRPLMLFFLRAVAFDRFDLFYLAIQIPAIVLPIFILITAERCLGFMAGLAAATLYFLLCYSLPSYYELQPLDFGGALAGIFACMAVLSLWSAPVSKWGGSVRFLLLCWVSMETKPMYAGLLAAAPLLMIARLGRAKGVTHAGAVILLAAIIFLKDRWLGSGFVGVGAQEGGSYQILGSLPVLWGALQFYAMRLLSPNTWLLVVVCGGLLMWSRWHVTLLVVVIASAAALSPILLIPNHRFAMYAWYSASLLLLVVPLCWAVRAPKLASVKVPCMMGLSLFALFGESHFLPTHRWWYEVNQLANAATIRSLPYVASQMKPGERVLISGRLNAYSPYRNDKFISGYLPEGAEWNVVAPPADDVLIPMANDTRRFLKLSDIDPAKYTLLVSYDSEGRVTYVGPIAPAFSGASMADKAGLLFCQQVGADGAWSIDQACLHSVGF